MSNSSLGIKFTPEWELVGDWYSVLVLVMENNSGKSLDNPDIKFELGQMASATPVTGFDFTQDGEFITGHLGASLRPVPDGTSVKFSIGLNYANGDFNGDYPVAYWVDGELAEDGGAAGLDDEPPTQPTGLQALNVTDTTISLTWNESTDNVGVDHYVIYSSPSVEGGNIAAPETNAVLRGLMPETLYMISVAAVDAAGNESEKSPEISVTTSEKVIDETPPSVPANLRAGSITSTSAQIDWDPSIDNVEVSGYEIQYTAEGGVLKTLSSPTNSISIGGLESETLYSVRVLAVDTSDNRSELSETLYITTAAAGSSPVPYAPYIDVTLFADWSSGPTAKINTLFIKDALALGVKKFHLAFLIHDPSVSGLLWGNKSFPLAAIKEAVDLINSEGGEAIFAFGGFSGLDPSVNMSVDELTTLYVDIAAEYGVRHIDFDFETVGLYNYAKAFPAAVAAKKQKPELHFSLTLPVAPAGLNAEGIAMVNAAKSSGLDVSVQIMAMDYGQGISDMGKAAVDAAVSTKNQLKAIYPEKSDAELFSLIGVTPMIGENDTGPETFFLSDIPTLTNFAKENAISLIGAWDLNRDFPLGQDSHGFSHTELSTCAKEPNQTMEYEFLRNFVKELAQ